MLLFVGRFGTPMKVGLCVDLVNETLWAVVIFFSYRDFSNLIIFEGTILKPYPIS